MLSSERFSPLFCFVLFLSTLRMPLPYSPIEAHFCSFFCLQRQEREHGEEDVREAGEQ